MPRKPVPLKRNSETKANNTMDWGIILCQDFYKTIPPVTEKETEWYQCVLCRVDLRFFKHEADCGLGPDQMREEDNRVSFIIRQMYKHRGLLVKQGGRNGAEETI